MNTYTPSTGNTPQGQQLAQGQPNVTNVVPPPGSPATAYPSDQQLNQSYATANQNLVNQGTPDKRQQYISNSNLPAMQSNYDDLARQLFEYDSSVLSPKFQGQNPGTPTDAAAFGRVDASPLGMTVGSAGLPASSGIYNANPKYAYTAQIDQGNNIANLLTTLLGGMSKEFGSRVGQYKSDTQAAQNALDSVFKIMQLKQDAIDKAAARANSGGLAGAKLDEAKNRLLSDAQKGVTFPELILRYTPDGLTPSDIRDLYNQINYYGKPAAESESDVEGYINGTKPTVQNAKAKAVQVEQDKQNKVASILSLKDAWSQIPTVQRITGQGNDYQAYNSQKQVMVDQLATSFGISRSNPAILRLMAALPGAGYDSTFSAGKFTGALRGFLVGQGYMLVKDKQTGDVGMILKTEFNKSKYEEVN